MNKDKFRIGNIAKGLRPSYDTSNMSKEGQIFLFKMAVMSKDEKAEQHIKQPDLLDDLIDVCDYVEFNGFSELDKGDKKSRYINATLFFEPVPERDEKRSEGEEEARAFYKHMIGEGIPATIKFYNKKARIEFLNYENPLERTMAEHLLLSFINMGFKTNDSLRTKIINRAKRARNLFVVSLGYLVCAFLLKDISIYLSIIVGLFAFGLFFSRYNIAEKSNYRKVWNIDER